MSPLTQMTHSCPLYTSRIECRTSVISGPPPCERGDSTTVAGVECSDPLIHDLSQALEPFRVVAPRRHDSHRLLMVLHALKISSRMRATTSLIRREWAPIESRPLLVACVRRGQHARWAHAHAERPDDDNHHPRNHHRRCPTARCQRNTGKRGTRNSSDHAAATGRSRS
jgi:hypothetical protein